jgi:hypothetical protein
MFRVSLEHRDRYSLRPLLPLPIKCCLRNRQEGGCFAKVFSTSIMLAIMLAQLDQVMVEETGIFPSNDTRYD